MTLITSLSPSSEARSSSGPAGATFYRSLNDVLILKDKELVKKAATEVLGYFASPYLDAGGTETWWLS